MAQSDFSAIKPQRKPITLIFCFTPNRHQVSIHNLNLEKTVSDLKTLVSERAKIPFEDILLVWCGNILDDDSTLKASGLSPGAYINVLKKIIHKPIISRVISESELHALVIAFRTLIVNPTYKIILQKLVAPDILNEILTVNPGLNIDPVALAILQDPELLIRLKDMEVVRKVVQKHPVLIEVSQHIAAAAHEEVVNTRPAFLLHSGSSHSNLDIFSDEEDDDAGSSQSSDSLSLGNFSLASTSRISAAQVAAAIASVTANHNSNNALAISTLSSSSNAQGLFLEAVRSSTASLAAMGPPSSVVSSNRLPPLRDVSDMEVDTSESISTLDNIEDSSVNEVYAPINTSTTPSNVPVVAETAHSHGNLPGNSGDAVIYSHQMQQMRELGLLNDTLNMQALQISSGNVHAAVDLIFSGTIG